MVRCKHQKRNKKEEMLLEREKGGIEVPEYFAAKTRMTEVS